tara:strand:- start:1577 stop:1939 length:363 start_codon:yes stop_codon:yes gene_type:complete
MPDHYDEEHTTTGQETNEAEQGPTSSVEQTERDKNQMVGITEHVRNINLRRRKDLPNAIQNRTDEEIAQMMYDEGARMNPETGEYMHPMDVSINYPHLLEKSLGNQLLKSIKSLMWRQGY